MNKLILLASAAILSVGTTSELRAACNDNVGFDCGTNCCYTKDEQNNYTFYKDPTAPANSEAIITNPVNAASDWGDYRDAVTAKIEYGITQIGRNAFDRSTKLVSINIPNSVTVIDYDAFWKANSLENIEIPDSVTKIGATAFGLNSKMKSILLPENIQEIDKRAFLTGYLPEGFTVYCKNKSAEQCKKLLTAKGGNAGLTYGDGIGCARISGTLGCTKCMINYKQNENFCNRVRYTPAEAAAVAKDDNTNVVTITFKK